MDGTEKCCGNCDFKIFDYTNTQWICNNQKSEFYTEPVSSTEGCSEFTEFFHNYEEIITDNT